MIHPHRWLLLVAAIALLLFSPTLRFGFIAEWDDAWLVLDNPHLQDPGLADLRAAVDPTGDLTPWGREYHPLRALSLIVDRLLWGHRPTGYHLTNVLLHAAASVLLYLMLLGLGLSCPAAAVGALVFAVHPLQVEPVAWLQGRRSCLALVGVTLGGLFWTRLPGRRIRDGLLPAACLAAAALSKANALALPALFVAIDLARPRREPLPWRTLWRPYVPVLVVLALTAALTLWAGQRAALFSPQPYGDGVARRVMVSSAFHLQYVVLAVWPLDIVIPYPWSPRVLPASHVGALLLLCGWIGLATAWAVRRARGDQAAPAPLLAALIWWPAALLPSLNLLVPLQRAFAARYAALATVSLGLAAAAAVQTGLRRAPRATMAGALLLLALLAAVTTIRLPDWRDSRTLWERGVERAPDNRMVWYKLGHSLDAEWRRTQHPATLERAAACYARAVALDPGFPDALHDLGVLREHQGMTDAASALYERALPKPLACFNLARLEARRGNRDRARALLRAALRGDPSLAAARRLLAQLAR